MNENHLLIGLGGTGGKIIRAFKKTLYQEYGDIPPKDRKIEYLYIDTNDEYMKFDDPTWKVPGKNLQLGTNQQLLIEGGDLKKQIENVNDYPAIKGWIGSRDHWRYILGSIMGKAFGSQRRRLGRFIFANHADDFHKKLNERVSMLKQGGIGKITFHVLCGLAGGTGSGSVIDTICQIRKEYPVDSKNYVIIVYALLPEPHTTWSTGNYHANGYAALMELNALSLTQSPWRPYDIMGKNRLDFTNPSFNICYLFSPENQQQVTVDVEKDVPSIIADYLYQKLITMDAASWKDGQAMEQGENSDVGEPEGDERSRRFMTFGVKRLAVPEEEIREYMTFSYARQAALQMYFNNPSDTAGYLDEARNLNVTAFVTQKENWQNWLITDEHLCLSLGILPEEINNKKWKPINSEWQDFIPHAQETAKMDDEDAQLKTLHACCYKRYAQDYRGVGVEKFYEIESANCKEKARIIRQRIESELFGTWKVGHISIHENVQILDALLSILSAKRQEIEEKIRIADENAQGAREKITENEKTWEKINVLEKLTGARTRLFIEQSMLLQECYIYLTRFNAWRFGQRLLDHVHDEVNGLRSEAGKCEGTIASALKVFTDQRDARCTQKEPDLKKTLVDFYDSEEVKNFTRDMVKNNNLQSNQAKEARDTLILQLGENLNFTTFNTKIKVADFIDNLLVVCGDAVKRDHNVICLNNKDKARQFGVNIIDKLYQRFGNDDEALRKFIGSLVNYAGNYLIFDHDQIQQTTKKKPHEEKIVLLPKVTHNPLFFEKLEHCFNDRWGQGGEPKITPRDGRPYEISFVSLANGFPLRYVKPVAFLKKKYDERTSGTDGERIRTEIHCEGDGTQHPKLFIPDEQEKNREELRLPYLILGKILEIITDSKSMITGKAAIRLITKDERGFDNDPIELGSTLEEAAMQVKRETIEIIGHLVIEKLSKEFRHIDRQEELMKKVLAEVDAIKRGCEYGVEDPVYKKFNAAGKRAVKVIESLGKEVE